MDLAALQSPLGSTPLLVASASTNVCTRLSMSNNERSMGQSVKAACLHVGGVGNLGFSFFDTFPPHVKAHRGFGQVYTATLEEEDAIVKDMLTENREDDDLTACLQFSRDETKALEQQLQAVRVREGLLVEEDLAKPKPKPIQPSKEEGSAVVDQQDHASQPRQYQTSGTQSPHVDKITVGIDELKPGVILHGKVTNIERYGAFVDVGAFTSGLIHISNMGNSFVNVVEDVVRVGDDVRVQVVFVNETFKRLSLKLLLPQEEVSGARDRESSQLSYDRSSRLRALPAYKGSKDNATPKPQKGEILNGVVSKITSTGVTVTLEQGHQGFLPAAEVLSSGEDVETSSFFRLGQHIPVRVLRTWRDRTILTMRNETNVQDDRVVLSNNDQEDRATSPFEIAFRRNKVIAKYLEDRERLERTSSDEKDGSLGV